MSKGKAFFSTMPGIISALAGLVTVIVGVLAIAAQLGWLSDDDGDGSGSSSGTTETTLAGGAGGAGGAAGGGGSRGSTPTASGRLSASPGRLEFEVLGAKEATVRVRNEANGPVSLNPPKMEGADSAQYSATYNCPPSLAADAGCDVKVTFKPTKAGRSTATLVVAPAAGSVRPVEVAIVGNHVL